MQQGRYQGQYEAKGVHCYSETDPIPHPFNKKCYHYDAGYAEAHFVLESIEDIYW